MMSMIYSEEYGRDGDIIQVSYSDSFIFIEGVLPFFRQGAIYFFKFEGIIIFEEDIEIVKHDIMI